MRRAPAVPLAAVLLMGLLLGGLLPGPTPAPRSAPAAPAAPAGTIPVAAPLDAGPAPTPAASPSAPGPASAPSLLWSTAQIFYGSTDPAGRLFGEGAGMVVDNRLQNTTTFGGHALDGLSNITLIYNNGTVGAWWYASSPVSPSARANVSFAADAPSDSAVLFGGLGRIAPPEALNDTWQYFFANETWVNRTGVVAPAPREDAAFAIDPTDGIGLLEGGLDPAYRVGTTTGAVLWNDTWQLNLTTLAWTPLALSASPPPLYGSSMVWDPVRGTFLLLGGCDAGHCASGVWSFAPGAGAWTSLAVGGSPPSPRGSSSVAWDPIDNVTLLYGGFAIGPTGPTPLGGTYVLDAAATAFTALALPNGPPALYGAATAFSNYPGCVGMWVEGGSPATQGIIYNVSLLSPVGEPPPNCFTPYGGGTGGPPPACSNTSAHLALVVRDAATGGGLAGATVDVTGACGVSAGTTGPGGYLNLTEAAPDTLTVSVARIGYHPTNLTVVYTGRADAPTVVDLEALPALHARVLARSAAGVGPLANATVTVGGVVVLGRTGPAGWLNVTTVPVATSTTTVAASAPGHSTAETSLALPFTGVAYANLTVAAFGPIRIDVVDALTGVGVSGAPGSLNFVDPIGANSTPFFADATGWFNTSLGAGNYTVSVDVPGYFPNATPGPFYHDWVNATAVRIAVTPIYGGDVAVRLVDARSGAPIPNGTVAFGSGARLASNAAGWANATDLEPPGLLRIEASALGYYPNGTTVTIAPYSVQTVLLPLAPAPPCSPFAPCPATNATGGPPATFDLLPPSGPGRLVLLLAPAVIVVAGALVAALGGGRAHRVRPGPIRSPSRREGPA